MTNLVPMPPPPGMVAAEPLSKDDYEAIKADLAGLRNAQVYLLIVRLLRNTGLRLSEVLRLTADQVISEGPYTFIWVYRGKSRRTRWERVAVHPEIGADLRAVITLHGKGSGRIIPIKKRTMQQQFSDAAKRALGRPAHLHQLRHLFISTLIDGGVPVGVAAKLVGHANVETTLGWYYDLTAEKRAEIARRMPT